MSSCGKNFWKCWKDTKYKGIYVSIYGFSSNCTYFKLGKQILLFELEDVVKMAKGQIPDWGMLKNFGIERKEVKNSVSDDRKTEFKEEHPPSQYESYRILLKLLHKLYRDDSFSKKYNKDNEYQIISIEFSQGSKKICTVPRKHLLETNSIALAEGGQEKVNRYTIGNYIPSKAMKAAKLGTVYHPENILGDKTDEVSNLSEISGKSRLENERSRLAEERINLSNNNESGNTDY